MTTSSTVLIVGASFSGLATAACLRRREVAYSIIEKEGTVGAPWRHHYDRLHLHTSKRLSGLPYRGWNAAATRYPGRLEVIGYLEAYQRAFDIEPHFQTEAMSIRRLGDRWITETDRGRFDSRFVVMATGLYGWPRTVAFAGQESFPGRVLHSYDYITAADFRGQRVLVVGFGNSACEIAIDLVGQGAAASMAVRSAVNIIPRDMLGIPVLELSLLLSHLPPRLADRIAGPTVRFADGRSAEFDAIVAAIGYQRNGAEIVEVAPDRFEDLRLQIGRQQHFGEDGLYFCGYWISPTEQIREISRDAKKIATDICKHSTHGPT